MAGETCVSELPISTSLSNFASLGSPSTPTLKTSVSSLFSQPSSAADTSVKKALYRKTALVSPNNKEYEELLNQLKTLISAGQGETFYHIGQGDEESPGLKDSDLDASIATLKSMAATLDADCVQLRKYAVSSQSASNDHTNSSSSSPAHNDKMSKDSGDNDSFTFASQLNCAEFLVRKRAEEKDFMEVRVAVVGNVDAGKSTLLGVLTHGVLDNGRGLARLRLFRHKHEVESGRTSSVGNDILGFDSTGAVVNKAMEHGGHVDWVKICEQSSKVITFIDLAGHERYLKTTVFGMTGHAPDFTMLMIGANAGVIGMTKEHLGLALALSVPVFVVVTKIDMCPPNVLQETLKLLQKLLKSAGCRKMPILISNADEVIATATKFTSERICPIFQVSNVVGTNLDLLKLFLNLLSVSRTRFGGLITSSDDPALFQIDDHFLVPGVGTVVSGTCLSGTIRLNDTLLFGPDPLAYFQPIVVKSIHRKRMPVTQVKSGQTSSFALKKIKRSSIRKGMVMVAPKLRPSACWEFEGEILVLHHPTTISVRYQAMVHVGSIRQTATILSMSAEHLRTGDKATVRFRFIKNPEFLRKSQRLVFREGRTKAVGTITALFPHPPNTGPNFGSTKQQQQQNSQQRGRNRSMNKNTSGGVASDKIVASAGFSPDLNAANDSSEAGSSQNTMIHRRNPENQPKKPSKRNYHRHRHHHHHHGGSGMKHAVTGSNKKNVDDLTPMDSLADMKNDNDDFANINDDSNMVVKKINMDLNDCNMIENTALSISQPSNVSQ